MTPVLLHRYGPTLRECGASAVRSPELLLASKSPYEVFYVPFEYVNQQARLVIVGITPGSTQLEIAYTEAQRLLRLGFRDVDVLQEIKKIAAFGGASMRPNLLRMLRHFRFADILGIEAEEELWSTESNLLHATSVVPNAAFKSERMFNGRFEEIMAADVLRTEFEEQFVQSLTELDSAAMYVALGRTPFDALQHCVDVGVIGEEQLLGAFPHPSTRSGSQVAVYLGETAPEDLNPLDPVRGRVQWLRSAYERMREATNDWRRRRP